MDATLAKVARWLAIVSATSAAFIAVSITFNVLARSLTSYRFGTINELSILLMVVVAFAGFAQAEVDETHVRMRLVTDRLGARTRQIARRISLLLTGVFLAVMSHATAMRALSSYQMGEVTVGVTRFPVWPVRAVITVGITALALVALRKALRSTPFEGETRE